MAGGSSEATLDINIDAKRSNSSFVREALFRATGEEKWMVSDEWAYFLKQRFSIFNDIAKAHPSKNWEIPEVGREIDKAFKVKAKGRIPDWAEPMIEYGKAVEWMRRQHWKNNKKKGELALGSGESAAGMSRVADDGPGVTPSVGGDRPGDGNRIGDGDRAGTGAGAGALGYWSDVLHRV